MGVAAFHAPFLLQRHAEWNVAVVVVVVAAHRKQKLKAKITKHFNFASLLLRFFYAIMNFIMIIIIISSIVNWITNSKQVSTAPATTTTIRKLTSKQIVGHFQANTQATCIQIPPTRTRNWLKPVPNLIGHQTSLARQQEPPTGWLLYTLSKVNSINSRNIIIFAIFFSHYKGRGRELDKRTWQKVSKSARLFYTPY